MTEFELEKIAMEKLNKLLHEHKVGFQFKRPPIDKWPWSMIEIDGRCLGRVYNLSSREGNLLQRLP